jgi:hypothetical protein
MCASMLRVSHAAVLIQIQYFPCAMLYVSHACHWSDGTQCSCFHPTPDTYTRSTHWFHIQVQMFSMSRCDSRSTMQARIGITWKIILYCLCTRPSGQLYHFVIFKLQNSTVVRGARWFSWASSNNAANKMVPINATWLITESIWIWKTEMTY